MGKSHKVESVSRRKFLLTAGAVGSTAISGTGAARQETTTGEALDFQNGEINFTVSPSVARERIQAQYQPIKEYLSNEFEVPAELKLANNGEWYRRQFDIREISKFARHRRATLVGNGGSPC